MPRLDSDLVEACAHAAHEANRAYCVVRGDLSHQPWAGVSAELADSTRQGVVRALADGLGPAEMHEAWVEHKLQQGWSYGSVKDEDARTHPCLVPYTQLPISERAKDQLFISVVQAVAEALRIGTAR